MTLKRTTVYADVEDLAMIKESAARQGIAEAEIIRQAIHLAAMSSRVWDEPFFSETYAPERPMTREDLSLAGDEAWRTRVEWYESTKERREQ